MKTHRVPTKKKKKKTCRIKTSSREASDINAHDHWKKRSIFPGQNDQVGIKLGRDICGGPRKS